MNLWTLKNKKLCIYTAVFILGLLTIAKQNGDMPEDKNLSSGYSVVRGSMVKIDNYANIRNYEYKLNKRNRASTKETTLCDQMIDIVNEIDIFAQPDDSKENTGYIEEYPQGLCITSDFVFISSYSGVRGNMGKIKVFDKENGELLLTLGMDENSHLGGLTFDGRYLWVCNSSKMSIEKIPYAFIQQMVYENPGKMIDARNLVDIYRVNNIPSCVSYYDGQLWVATHSIWTNATMVGYHYNEEKNRLSSMDSVWIPSKVQGVAFSEDGEVYLSTSYGRRNSSYIKKYDSIYAMTNDVDHYAELIELPPCSEGIVYRENKIYILFESAGRKYLEGTDGKGKSVSPLNKIVVIEKQKAIAQE